MAEKDDYLSVRHGQRLRVLAMPLDNIEDPAGTGNPFGDEGQAFPALNGFLDRRGANSPAAMMLKERALADREHLDTQRFGLDAQKMELEKVHELASIEKERLQIASTMEMHRQTTIASKALSALDGTEPDYQKRVLQIQADNPLAARDPVISRAIEFRNQQALEHERAQTALDTFSAEEKIRQADAMAREQNEEANREKMAAITNTNMTAREQAEAANRDNSKILPDPRETELQKTYGLTKDSLLNPIQSEGGKVGPDGKFVVSEEGEQGTAMRLIVNDGKGDQKDIIMPMDDYNRQVSRAKLPFVQNDNDFGGLKSGDQFVDPEGNIRKKP
jgi:hypothetical protein